MFITDPPPTSKSSAFSPWPCKQEDTSSQQQQQQNENADDITDRNENGHHSDIAEHSDEEEEEEELSEDDDEVNVDDDTVNSKHSTLNDTSVRHKPSIFSVSSLLSDDKNERMIEEKEEDEITLPSHFQHHAMAKPPFFYPGIHSFNYFFSLPSFLPVPFIFLKIAL